MSEQEDTSAALAHHAVTSVLHSWRSEVEIDVERKKFLAGCLGIQADVSQSIYPFKDVRLSRADVEWLLVRHEQGRGPVDWSDIGQRERVSLDLRGADLRRVNLRELPLARMVGGLNRDEWQRTTLEQRDLAGMHLERADLSGAHLEGAVLEGAYLDGATLRGAFLQSANLFRADLRNTYLRNVHFEWATLEGARLQGAYLPNAYCRVLICATPPYFSWDISLLALAPCPIFCNTSLYSLKSSIRRGWVGASPCLTIVTARLRSDSASAWLP